MADVSPPHCSGLSLPSALGLVLITWEVKATTLDSWTRGLGGSPQVLMVGGGGEDSGQWIKSGDWTLVSALPLTLCPCISTNSLRAGVLSPHLWIGHSVHSVFTGNPLSPGSWCLSLFLEAQVILGHEGPTANSQQMPLWDPPMVGRETWAPAGLPEASCSDTGGGWGSGGVGKEAKMNQRKSLPRVAQSKGRMVMGGSKFLRSLIPALTALSAHFLLMD